MEHHSVAMGCAVNGIADNRATETGGEMDPQLVRAAGAGGQSQQAVAAAAGE